MKGKSYTSTPRMGCTACTESQCLYKGALYLLPRLRQRCSQRHRSSGRRSNIRLVPNTSRQHIDVIFNVSEVQEESIYLKMGPLLCLETLVNNPPRTRRHIQDKRRPHEPLYVQQNGMHHVKREREQLYLAVNEILRSTAYLLLRHGENLLWVA